MSKLRVLIVDDAAANRNFIRYCLEKSSLDIETEEASNGREAQVKLDKSHFDLVLCDWNVPVVDGAELLKWLRTHPLLKDVPFIMIIKKGDGTDVVRAMQAGVNGYLVRPFTAEDLLMKMTAADRKFDRRRHERAEKSGFVTLRFRDAAADGTLIDASMGGVLGIFNAADPLPQILERVMCDIRFENGATIFGVEGFPLRAQAMEASPDSREVKIAIKFLPGGEEKLRELKDLFNSQGR